MCPEIAEANGPDPLDLVVSLNVKRRNMSKSQAAVAGAEWLQVNFDSDEVTNAVRRRIAKRFNTSDGYIQQARTLVTDAPDLAALVKTGDRLIGLSRRFAK